MHSRRMNVHRRVYVTSGDIAILCEQFMVVTLSLSRVGGSEYGVNPGV